MEKYKRPVELFHLLMHSVNYNFKTTVNRGIRNHGYGRCNVKYDG